MKDPAPLFDRMRAYAARFAPHADALRVAADELERVNRWLLPGMPEPTPEQIEEIGIANAAANRAVKSAHIAEMRILCKEIPSPC